MFIEKIKQVIFKNRFNLSIFFILFLFFNFYTWLITSGSYNFHFKNFQSNEYVSYHHLVDSFLVGKLHLLQEPRQELSILSDPYDPSLNAPYRWHDASLYKEKYYLCFGITPALLFYLPYKLLTKQYLPCTFVDLIFVFGTLAWSTLLLIHFKNKYFQNTSNWMLYMAICLVGLANMGPALVDANTANISIYNVSTTGGTFFLLGALYFLCQSTNTHIPNLSLIAGGSLMLGLAVGCRPHFSINFIVLLIFLIKVIKDNIETNFSFKLRLVAFLLLPFCLYLIGLLIYNYLRFGTPLEFGYNYNLGNIRLRFLYLQALIPNIYAYLFMPLKIDNAFPFFYMTSGVLPEYMRFPQYYNLENMAGTISCIPFLVCPIFYWLYLSISNKKFHQPQIFKYFELKLLFISACLNFLFLLLLSSTSLRFTFDFRTLFLVIACTLWFYFDSLLVQKLRQRIFLRTLAVLLAIISMWYGFAYGISSFRSNNTYQPLSSVVKYIDLLINVPIGKFGSAILKPTYYFFTPIASSIDSISSAVLSPAISAIRNRTSKNQSDILQPMYGQYLLTNNIHKGQILITNDNKTIFWFNGKYWIPIKDDDKQHRSIASYGPVNIKIKFNNPAPKEIREPLLTTGKTETGDFVYVEYLSSKEVVFGIDHWGTSGARGKPIFIDPEKFYDLRISIGSLYPNISLNKELLNKMEIRLDNKVILEAQMESHPTTEKEITVGECMIEVYHGASRFSGDIREIRIGDIELN